MQSPSRLRSTGQYSSSTSLASEAQRQPSSVLLTAADLQRVANTDVPASLLSAIASSQEILQRQDTALTHNAKDLANITASRTKQMSAKHERANQLERETFEQREQEATIGREVRSTDELVISSRAKLAERQSDVEALQQKIGQMSRLVSDSQRRADQASSALQSHLSSSKVERERLERKGQSLEGNLAQLSEGLRRLTVNTVPQEAAHRDLLSAKRRDITAAREKYHEAQKTLSSLRQLLEDNARDMEEAMKRRRRAQEEAVRDNAAQRRAAQLQANSEREERERAIRSQTDAQVEDMKSKLDTLMGQLALAREEESRLFNHQLHLRDQCAALSLEVVGSEALLERATATKGQVDSVLSAVSDLQSESLRLRAILSERARQVSLMSDTVAPLKDVEDNCAKLAAECHATASIVADREAEQAVWRVRDADHIATDQDTLIRTQNEIEATRLERIAVVDRNREAIRTLDNEIRDLTEDSRALTSKITDMSSRNASLDQTLDHIARQRRAMAEELALRRDAARMAAANLLAQLE